MSRMVMRLAMTSDFIIAVWLIFLGLEISLFHDSSTQKADAAIVLGAAVNGNKPSLDFEQPWASRH